MKYLAIIVGLIIVIPVFGQRKKKDDNLTVAPTYVEGIAYSLPRTGVRIYVTAVKQSVMAGPFNGYAEQLLGIKNVPSKSSVNWSISEIQVETFSEPDPDQVYKAFGSGAFLLNLTADGRLAGINSGKSTSEIIAVKTNQIIQKPEFDDGFSFDYFTDTPFYIPGDSTNGFKPMRISAEQKAAEAAKRILDARTTQFNIVSWMMDGEHPDGEAYKTSLNELKRIEKDYLSLFVGRTTYKKEKYSFDFVPVKTNGKGEVVFRISNEKGVVPASDLSGKPVLIEFELEKNLIQKYDGMVVSENPSAGESGVYYRMPGIATIKIIHELNTIATARAAIAQFGVVAPIPEELLYGEFAIEIHPETGAIKSISNK